MLLNINRNLFQSFPFHLVTISPWPILVSFSLLNLTLGAVLSMHGYGDFTFIVGLASTGLGMLLWFRDIILEATYLGCHTTQVQKGLTIGVILFIVSEVFAFLSVFWAFFHSSLSPSVEIGGVWPPQGIEALSAFGIPLLNTFLLLSSGSTITYGHHVRRARTFIKFSQENIYHSYIYAVGELGRGESPRLNIASHNKAVILLNLLSSIHSQTVPPMVKTILFEVHYPLPSPIGDHLGRDGMFKNCSQLRGGWTIWVVFTNYVINIIKDKSEQPKGGN